MNLKALAAAMLESASTVVVYFSNPKEQFTFLIPRALAQNLKADDPLIANGTTVTVVSVDLDGDLNLEALFEYKFIDGVLNREGIDDCRENVEDKIQELKKAARARAIQQATEALSGNASLSDMTKEKSPK